jgi:hypothetical protein
MMMEAAGSSKTLLFYLSTTQCHNLENLNLNFTTMKTSTLSMIIKAFLITHKIEIYFWYWCWQLMDCGNLACEIQYSDKLPT